MTGTYIDDEIVEKAEEFLLEILRHKTTEYNISLDSHGWVNTTNVAAILDKRFQSPFPSGELLFEVVNRDDENLFQTRQLVSVESFGEVTFIRATRGHTLDYLKLLDVLPSEERLNWYIVSRGASEYFVEAVSKEAVQRIFSFRLRKPLDLDKEDQIQRFEGDVIWSQDEKDSLNKHSPNTILHQRADEYLKVEKRVNQAGDKGRYVTPQPASVRGRLPSEFV